MIPYLIAGGVLLWLANRSGATAPQTQPAVPAVPMLGNTALAGGAVGVSGVQSFAPAPISTLAPVRRILPLPLKDENPQGGFFDDSGDSQGFRLTTPAAPAIPYSRTQPGGGGGIGGGDGGVGGHGFRMVV